MVKLFRSVIFRGSLIRLAQRKVGGNNMGKAIMDFEFADRRTRTLARTGARVSSGQPSANSMRKVLDGDARCDVELWQKVAEMGWTATVIPEEFGGFVCPILS